MALVHGRDQWHQRAVDFWRVLQAGRREPITTNLVIAESHGLIARRIGVIEGLRFLDAFGAGRGLTVAWVDEDLTRAAVDRWLRRFADRPFSLTDATSFEVMEREAVREAFAFDAAFERAGFRLLP